MLDSNSESLFQAKFFASRYQERDAPAWNQLKTAAEQTTIILRDVVEGLVEHYDRIGDEELTTLYRLCQNSNDGLSAEEKRGQIRTLNFPENEIEEITQAIDDSVGSVGAVIEESSLYVGGEGEYIDAEKELYDCLKRLTENYESKSELVAIADDLINIDFHKVQSGQLSLILHYLVPTVFPVINGRSRDAVELLFGENISIDLVDYVDERGKYLSLRDQLDVESHFRDLDYFLHWVQTDENEWTEALREGVHREVWQVQPGHGKYSVPDELWPIWQDREVISSSWIGDVDEVDDEMSGWTANFVTEMSKGDLVIAKGGVHSLLGLGVIVEDDYKYVGGTDMEIPVDRADETKVHESIRHVEWFFSRGLTNPIDIDDLGLSKQFASQWIVGYYNWEELRWNISERYSDDAISALRLLESKSVAYALGQEPPKETLDPDNDLNPIEEPPDAPERAQEIERQLEAKNQVVFYGPPGTGKTYTAKQFARWWVGQQDVVGSLDDRVDTVTFHPSFTYEDFVEGLSAETDSEGQVAYEINDGKLKEILEPAMEAYTESKATGGDPPRYVLIIDEINRGNLAQIFGELITLLEADKRGSFDVDLAHSGDSVTLPPNLYLIGTMNTADQSIALVDTALRRRFRFIDFPPELDIVWTEATVESDSPRAAIDNAGSTTQFETLLAASALAFRELNDRILHAPDLGKGKQLGHSHLLGHATPTEIVDVWRYDILPQLEEYYFGQFDRLRDELLTETGDLLVLWDEEQIKSFTAEDLYQALCNIAGIEDASLANQTETSQPESNRDAEHIDDSWGGGEKTVDAFRERVERNLDTDMSQRIKRLLSLGTDIGWVDTGRGENSATAQLKSESVDPNVGIIQIRQNGAIEFKWNWLVSRDQNDLTGEFIDSKAGVFDRISDYNHAWQPEADEDGNFVEPTLEIQELSAAEMDTLIEGLQTFVEEANDLHNG